MPRLPEGNPALASLKPSVFSTLVARLARHDGPTFPLHVGDTYLAPRQEPGSRSSAWPTSRGSIATRSPVGGASCCARSPNI